MEGRGMIDDRVCWDLFWELYETVNDGKFIWMYKILEYERDMEYVGFVRIESVVMSERGWGDESKVDDMVGWMMVVIWERLLTFLWK